MHFIRKDENPKPADPLKSGEEQERPEKVLKPEEPAGERTTLGTPSGGPQLVKPEPQPAGEGRTAALFPEAEMHELRSRWEKIQTAFVDEPRQAVEQADKLVASAIQRLSEQFAAERSRVEKEWTGGEISTESLRQSLRKYRAFFERLLSV